MTDYPEGWEEWVAFLFAQLPAPVLQETEPGGATFFTAGDPAEVLVRLSVSSITVSVCLPERADLEPQPKRLGTIMWRRVPSNTAIGLVEALVKCARAMRLDTYRECQVCGQMKPPERMQDDEVCLDCAEPASEG